VSEIIRLGDPTSHGGVVLEAFGNTNLNGKPIAGLGHNVSCPSCKGVFPIVQGSSSYSVDGVPVALDGMKTACGASLIATGSKGNVQ
jgi:uncharacterized Zn-binding protein involved in type VI secretion